MNKLARYIEKNGLRKNFVAQHIGIDANAMTTLLSGKRIPSISLAYEIEKFTHQEVRITDWLDKNDGCKKNHC